MTAYDLKLYTCQACHYHLGNKKFNIHALKNYKYNGYMRLVCTQCQEISGGTAVRHRGEKKARKVENLAQKMKNRGENPRPRVNGKRSIDDGGRVLMNMDIEYQFPDGLRPDFEDFLHTLTESMIRIGRHKRRAHDGVAYTWTEFVEWYGHVQVAYEHWRAAGPISCEYGVKLINSSDERH